MAGGLEKSQATPFLRWAGSKRAAVPELRRFIPASFNRYFEPFAGSACLYFHISPRKAVLSDLNDELIQTYIAVKKDYSAVSETLSALPFGRESYYDVRRADPSLLTEIQRAARFIYLNRFCFNGLYRTNLSGGFNVPFGAPRSSAVPSEIQLKLCSDALQNTRLYAGDFEEIVANNVGAGDFVYLDPPFFQNEGRVFRQYNSMPFIKKDLERLSNLLNQIDKKGATFLLSYAENSEATELFGSWSNKTILLQRNIAGFAQARGKAREIIASNKSLL